MPTLIVKGIPDAYSVFAPYLKPGELQSEFLCLPWIARVFRLAEADGYDAITYWSKRGPSRWYGSGVVWGYPATEPAPDNCHV